MRVFHAKVLRTAVSTADLGLPSPNSLRLLLLTVSSLFLLFRGKFLLLLSLVVICALLHGSRRNILLSNMADLPGGLELLLILFPKVNETAEVTGIFKGFLDILEDLGSDATPMTPRTVVREVRSFNWNGLHERRIQ